MGFKELKELKKYSASLTQERRDIFERGLKQIRELVEKSNNKIIYLYRLPVEEELSKPLNFKIKLGGNLYKPKELEQKVDLEQQFKDALVKVEDLFAVARIESKHCKIAHYGYKLQYNDRCSIYTTLTKNPLLKVGKNRLDGKTSFTLYNNLDPTSSINPKLQYETPFIYAPENLIKTSPIGELDPNHARSKILVSKGQISDKFRTIKFALSNRKEIIEETAKGGLKKTLISPTTDLDIVTPRSEGLLRARLEAAREARNELKKFYGGTEYESRLILNMLAQCPAEHDCLASHIDTDTGQVVHFYSPAIEWPPTRPSSPAVALSVDEFIQLFSLT